MDEVVYYAVGVIAILAYVVSGWMDGRKRETDERRDAHAAHLQIAAIREHLAAMSSFDPAAFAVLEHRVETLESSNDNGDQMRSLNERIAELVGTLNMLEPRLKAVEKAVDRPAKRTGKD